MLIKNGNYYLVRIINPMDSDIIRCCQVIAKNKDSVIVIDKFSKIKYRIVNRKDVFKPYHYIGEII